MYTSYFGFKEIPFNTLSNPDEFFFSLSARNCETAVIKAIRNHCAAMFLWGDPGVGKSALLRRLAHDLIRTHRFIFPAREGPRIEPVLDCLARLFDLELAGRAPTQKLELLRQKLADSEKIAASQILVIDDAHELPAASVGALLGLAQNRTGRIPRIQLLFAGSPALKSRTYESLQGKINLAKTYWHPIENLTDEEVHRFINQRIEIAGYHGKPLFSDRAVDRIIAYSAGNIGKVSVLCGFSLLNASLENRKMVTDEIVEEEAGHCLLNRDRLPDEITVPLVRENTSPKSHGGFHPGSFRGDIAARYEELGIPRPDIESRDLGDPETRDSERDGTPNSDGKNRYLTSARHARFFWSAMLLVSMLGSDGHSNSPAPRTRVSDSNRVTAEALVATRGEALTQDSTGFPLDPNAHSGILADIEIRERLLKAQEQIMAQRLIAPAGDSALDTYQEIAVLVKKQLQTLDGMVRIKQIYRRLALEAEIQGDWVTAEKFYAKAFKLSPHDGLLETAIARVRNQRLEAGTSRIRTGRPERTKPKVRAETLLWTERDSRPAGLPALEENER